MARAQNKNPRADESSTLASTISLNVSPGCQMIISVKPSLLNTPYVFNPHQRCGYSDSPFARIYFFYTAGSRHGLEGVGCRVSPYKMGQFMGKITEFRVSTFWRSGNPMFSRRRPMPACSPVSFKQSRPFPCNIWPR